jgi:hypothetical protein
LSTKRESRARRLPLNIRSLIRDESLFRLTVGMQRDPAVEAWLAEDTIALRSIAQKWFALMRSCGDDVRELMHDGCPVACVEDAPFGYVNTFKEHVNVGFFCGALLQDPSGMLVGSGKRMRHVRLRPGVELNAEGLSDLISAAYVDIKERLK